MPLKSDLDKAREIKAFLEKNYRKNYNYDFLEKKFGLNKFKLKQAFKIVSGGDNIHEFVTKVRIEHAKVYLENTDKTMVEIAASIGIDKSNFNLHFKRLTGKTPSEWRKNPGQDGELPFQHTGT